MSKLKDVFLLDFLYPCATYVVKRLGIDMSPKDLYQTTGKEYDGNPESLSVGDVLVWNYRKDSPTLDVVMQMTDRGPITSRKIQGKHLGVYEGDGLVSDLTFYEDPPIPFIRQIPLEEIKSRPLEVISYDTLKDR